MKLIPAVVLIAVMGLVEPVMGQNFQNTCEYKGLENNYNLVITDVKYECKRRGGFADQCGSLEMESCIGVTDEAVLTWRTESNKKKLRSYKDNCNNCNYNRDKAQLQCYCTVKDNGKKHEYFPTSVHLSSFVSNRDGYMAGKVSQCRSSVGC